MNRNTGSIKKIGSMSWPSIVTGKELSDRRTSFMENL